MANLKRKNITVARHKFTLEIYPARNGCHGKEGPYFEIFPHNYNACLYAFSNKKDLNKHIEDNYIYEPTNKLDVPRKFRLENTN